MTWANEHATALWQKGRARLAESRFDVALATFVRAFDVLDQAGDDAESRALRVRLAQSLAEAVQTEKDLDALIPRAARVGSEFARLPAAPTVIKKMIEGQRKELEAIDLYLAYLEAHGPMDDALRARLLMMLAQALRIRTRSDPDQVRSLVPRLERLHACRPGLDFPTLYLGTMNFLDGDFTRARNLLTILCGPIKRTPKVLNMLGRCAEKLGNIEEAVLCFEQSVGIKERQGNIHFRLGRGLLRLHEAAEIS